MTKHNSRADRKSKRQRASRAKERGLPAAPSEAPRDPHSFATQRSAKQRDSAQNYGSAWLLVLVGAILALGVVFVIAQNRKAKVMAPLTAPAPLTGKSAP